MEEWKDVVGYEGLYQVSNLGRVRSVDRYVPHKKIGSMFCKGCVIKHHINNAGYATVNLSKNNKYISFDVHRLVAIAFLDGSDIYNLEVNHKDENKLNNCINNLEWVTKIQNNNFGTKVARQKEKIQKAISQYDIQGNFIRDWKSSTDAEKSISGKFTGAISHCINGKSKSAYGYIWKYREAERLPFLVVNQ